MVFLLILSSDSLLCKTSQREWAWAPPFSPPALTLHRTAYAVKESETRLQSWQLCILKEPNLPSSSCLSWVSMQRWINVTISVRIKGNYSLCVDLCSFCELQEWHSEVPFHQLRPWHGWRSMWTMVHFTEPFGFITGCLMLPVGPHLMKRSRRSHIR